MSSNTTQNGTLRKRFEAQLNRSPDKYRHRIWSTQGIGGERYLPPPPPEETTTYQDFFEKAFRDFIPGPGLSCAVLCESSDRNGFSCRVAKDLETECFSPTDRPVNHNTITLTDFINNFSEQTTEPYLKVACNRYLNANTNRIIDPTFRIGQDSIFCHITPHIESDDYFLQSFCDVVCFEIIFAFLGEYVTDISNSDLETLADAFLQTSWTSIRKRDTIDLLNKLTPQYPSNWCFLISLPYNTFDTILGYIRNNQLPYVDRNVQIIGRNELLILQLVEELENLQETRSATVENEKFEITENLINSLLDENVKENIRLDPRRG